MTEIGIRWVFDPADSFAHVLADTTAARPGALVTICGRELPTETTPTFSVAPSLAVCPTGPPDVSRGLPPCFRHRRTTLWITHPVHITDDDRSVTIFVTGWCTGSNWSTAQPGSRR